MNWRPIEEAKKSEEDRYLLWFPKETLAEPLTSGVDDGLAITGWWFSSPKEIDDGWETPIGFIGEPSHFAYASAPDCVDLEAPPPPGTPKLEELVRGVKVYSSPFLEAASREMKTYTGYGPISVAPADVTSLGPRESAEEALPKLERYTERLEAALREAIDYIDDPSGDVPGPTVIVQAARKLLDEQP